MDNTQRWRDRPTPTGALVGREAEIDSLATWLTSGNARLVSVVGPGGQGKTRVALAVADRLERHFADGVAFVSLAGVARPDQVPAAVSAALGVGGSSAADPVGGLVDALADRDLMVIVDNFEHVREAADVLGTLLTGCDGLHLLVTSRVPSGLTSERLLELGPLEGAVIDAADPGIDDPAAVSARPAIELFVARARVADPGFTLDGHNLSGVVEVSRHLGGSPLAIELAASRLSILSVDELGRGLAAHPVAVLAHGAPALPDRQRSIQATIDWSHDLLDPAERHLLDALSTAEHGFGLATAAAVAGVDEIDVIDPLQSLVDHHFVTVTRGATTTPGASRRFALPRPVRDVLRGRLAGTESFERATGRLVEHVVDFGAEAGRRLESPDELEWLGMVGDELDQIRVVLGTLADRAPEQALALAAALGPYWLHRGLLAEGRAHLGGAVSAEVDRTISPEVVARAAAWEARLAADQGVIAGHHDATRMLDQLRAGLDRARVTGDVHDELRAIDFLSHVLVLHGDPGGATEITDEGIDLARRADRPWWLAQLLQRAAVFARLRGDLAQARRQARESATIARSIGAARPLLHVGLTLAQLPDGDAGADGGVGGGRVIDGDVPTLAELLELADVVGDRRMECVVRTSIGIEAMFVGDMVGAAGELRRVLRLAADTGYWHATGFGLMSIAALAALEGRSDTVARLHAVVEAWSDVLQRGMPPAYFASYNQLVDDTRRAVGHDTFDRWMDEARSLDFSRATVLAHRLLDDVVAAHGSPAAATEAASANPLTRRELEVLRCIAAGDTNKDIARRLSISPKTVMHHTTSIYRKLDVHGRAEAAATALRLGLLDS